jgi:hypothetical protein
MYREDILWLVLLSIVCAAFFNVGYQLGVWLG